MEIGKSTIDMIEKCGCEDCKYRSVCNIGVDLVNCYALKTLAIITNCDILSNKK